MNCMNCGALVTKGTEYCPKCGFHVLSQQKAIYLSKLYYNQGLEKASVRDLSGAINCLKQSLKFSKLNVPARNLLGLVYFETGEVVAALSEWVISKNIMPDRNLANDYIDKLQANPGKLDTINRTVNKYNLALSYCRQGNEDMAEIQLKKLLSQNPKLIKGYHLLALLQIKNEAYNKARRTLKKALKIDKTNTTTLRFLREVDEQTGMTTDLSGRTRRLPKEENDLAPGSTRVQSGNDFVILPPAFRETSMFGIFLNILLGAAIGVAAMWLLVLPAKTREAYDSVNREVLESGGTLSTQATQIEQLQQQVEEAQETAQSAQDQLAAAQAAATAEQQLLSAYRYYVSQDYDSAALAIRELDSGSLSEESQSVYATIRDVVSPGLGQDDSSTSDSGDADNVDSGSDSGDSGNYSNGDSGDYNSDSGY